MCSYAQQSISPANITKDGVHDHSKTVDEREERKE